MPITSTERRELRSAVRQQFRVLRAEVGQRKAEMLAEAAGRVRGRYAEADKALADLRLSVAGLIDEVNRTIIAAVKEVSGAHAGQVTWGGHVRAPSLEWAHEDRWAMQNALTTAIDAECKAALVQLDRQEADLLRALALGALESEEAREFLRGIPTVASLVPAGRLAELEASWDDGDLK